MGGVVKAVTKVVTSIFKFVGSLFSGIFGWLSPSIPQYDNRSEYDAYSQGTFINKQSSSAHIPVVYGRKRIGGTRVYVSSAGDNNKYLFVILAVAEGEIDRFEKIIIDDTEISEITSRGGIAHGETYTVNSGKYAVGGSRLKLQVFNGQENQGHTSLFTDNIDGVVAPGWSNNHRLRGIAYIAARFEWRKATEQELKDQINNNPYQGLPTIQTVIRGKKVRTLTGLTENQADTFSETYAQMIQSGSYSWSQNPAECLYDYLRNPRFGKNLSTNSIDTVRFRQAAIDCDQSKNFTRTDGTVVSKSFLKTNITIDTSKKMLDNTKALLECCRGYLPYTNGRYGLKLEAGVSTSGLFEIDDHMVIGKISFMSGNKSNTYNRGEVSFSNEDSEYETDIVVFEDSTYLTEDENEVLEIKHNSPGITDPDRAYDQARLLVMRSRNQNKIQFKGTAELQQLEAGDVFKFTHQFVFNPAGADDYMFDETLFRVLQVKVNSDMTCDVSAVIHLNDIYAVETYQIPVIQNKQPKRFRDDIGTLDLISNPVEPPSDGTPQPVVPEPVNNLRSPDFEYTLSVFDRPQIGTNGVARVLMSYSGLSTFCNRMSCSYSDGTTVIVGSPFPIYHTEANNLPITGDLPPGTYTLSLKAYDDFGTELLVFRDQRVNISPRSVGGSTVITAAAAEQGFV